MEFFNSAVDVLKTLVVALGAGLGVWGAGKNSLPGEMVPPGRRLQRNRAVIQTPPGSAGRGTWVLPAFCRSGEARRLICAHLRMDHPAADPAKALPTISLGLVCAARGKIHKAGFDFAGAKR